MLNWDDPTAVFSQAGSNSQAGENNQESLNKKASKPPVNMHQNKVENTIIDAQSSIQIADLQPVNVDDKRIINGSAILIS